MSGCGGMDYCRPPCTASNDELCQINSWLGVCNEVLFGIGMQLRERRCGSLSLECLYPRILNQIITPKVDSYLASTFLRWLLRTHVCITSLKLVKIRQKKHSQIILEELRESPRLKKLIVRFYENDDPTVQMHITSLLPRLRGLEQLYLISICQTTDALIPAVSALLRTTTSLNVLVFSAGLLYCELPKIFIDALASNSTLKSVNVSACWNPSHPAVELKDYLNNNGLLTSLTVCYLDQNWGDPPLVEALVGNRTLSSLRILCASGGEGTVGVLTRVLVGCAALKNLFIGLVRDKYTHIPEATLKRCTEALAENTTLEELELPYALWSPNNWIAFFVSLQRNVHIKKIEVSHFPSTADVALPTVLAALEQTKSSARVSFGSCTNAYGAQLMRSKAFSAVIISGEDSAIIGALQDLRALDHITRVMVELPRADEHVFSSLAEYVRETTVLRELTLRVRSQQEPPADTAGFCPWVSLCESISSNKSIATLALLSSGKFKRSDLLAKVVVFSKNITRVLHGEYRRPWNATEFVMLLNEAVGDNYNILELDLRGGRVAATARSSLLRVEETTRRNTGLVKRAASFNQTAPLDWYTANALEKVSRRPALVRELAEREGMAEDEVGRLIRSRLRSVEGLDDYMQLTGVVKRHVRCAPPPSGCSKQLDDLNDDCWRILRSFLSFDDVKRFTAAQSESFWLFSIVKVPKSFTAICISAAIRIWKYFFYSDMCARLGIRFRSAFNT